MEYVKNEDIIFNTHDQTRTNQAIIRTLRKKLQKERKQEMKDYSLNQARLADKESKLENDLEPGLDA